MHNITAVLLKNHQIMPYKRKLTTINNFGVVKNKCCIQNSFNKINYSKSMKNNYKQKMSTFLIVCVLIEFCSNFAGVNCNIINFSTKARSINNNNYKNNQLPASNTKEEYLKSLQQVFKSTLVSNNSSFKTNGSSSIDKFNISETEFTTKYREYLELVEHRRQKDALLLSQVKANMPKSRHRRAIDNNDLIYMHFDLSTNILNDTDTIDEASLILSLAKNRHRSEPPYGSKARQNASRRNRRRQIKIHVYQLSENFDRIWLHTVNLTTHKFPSHRKIRLNVQRAVESWLRDTPSNEGLQIYCEGCHAHGIYVVHENGMTNVPGSAYPTLQLTFKGRQREKRWQRSFKPVFQDYFSRKHTKCSKKSGKCCRKELKVQFQEISGLDFVIQPKMFDAGYCDGSCPTAYNPASEHAVLQARLVDTGKYNISRPCCAPAILSDVDVLHVDEEDDTKLKVTTFKNMRVLQCACT